MKTQRKVDALIKHLGLEFEDRGQHPLYGLARWDAKVTCPDENGITNRVEALENRFNNLPKLNEDIVECKTCHCLLKKESAIKGEKRIETVPWTSDYDYIVQDYFCGRCAPRRKK